MRTLARSVAEVVYFALQPLARPASERDFFIDNLLVRIHFFIVIIRWIGLAPLNSLFQVYFEERRPASGFKVRWSCLQLQVQGQLDPGYETVCLFLQGCLFSQRWLRALGFDAAPRAKKLPHIYLSLCIDQSLS